jgi:hypothetical protein
MLAKQRSRRERDAETCTIVDGFEGQALAGFRIDDGIGERLAGLLAVLRLGHDETPWSSEANKRKV